MKDIKRNSFIFYRSFLETCEEFPDPEIEDLKKRQFEADKLELTWLRGIANFALNGVEPIFQDRILRMAWKNVFPVIYKTNQLYKNGMLGGRPKKETTENQNETNTKPKENQNETKTKPKENQNESKTKPKENQNESKAKPYISNSSNNNIIKELEQKPEREPAPKQNEELNEERESNQPLSIENFKNLFSTKIIDVKEIPKNVDMEKLISAIKQSKFLSDPNVTNLKLSWFFDNYEDVVAGKWAKFSSGDKKFVTTFKGRKNKADDLALFDSIDDLEV